ncbi:helix-turn-helix domain-containing protein [Musicola keenii]|uniref:helix-turn-helix domain-containing protein n=1 Tax=Musicola keenii TaxID=2884250 RepID=UPI00177A9712|nr:helix-turn-helix transcriptional regulator [Musicola keenii]
MIDKDWHPADIIAGLRKRGTTLAAVSRASGLASSTLANALIRHWPKGERLIADALGKQPEDIWPSRYQDMSQNHGEGEAQLSLRR